jgi:hypothetical protein
VRNNGSLAYSVVVSDSKRHSACNSNSKYVGSVSVRIEEFRIQRRTDNGIDDNTPSQSNQPRFGREINKLAKSTLPAGEELKAFARQFAPFAQGSGAAKIQFRKNEEIRSCS